MKKPAKPYPTFPLYAHASGQWAKKIRGHVYYFGVWSDPHAALELYQSQADDLHAGRAPRPVAEGLTLGELADLFIASKLARVNAGELTPRMHDDYLHAITAAVKSIGRHRVAEGLGPADFAQARADAAKRLGPSALASFVQRVRTMFRWGLDNHHLDRVVRYGTEFAKPPKRAVRLARVAKGSKLISAKDCRVLARSAGSPLDAMVLLGLNCGLGQSDCSSLPVAALDLKSGLLEFPRPKTGIGRRCPLWPETIKALRQAIADRPTPKDKADEGLVFATKYGNRWVRYREKGGDKRGTSIDSVALMFKKLVAATGASVTGGFYSLRHTFRTIADEVHDRPAIDLIMGHDDPTMGGHYREKIGNDRLKAVTDHVRGWLWPGRK